jgi:prepilin-type processing-associated H-X9-DG protein
MKRPCLTLVELLAVIVIIALLVAILLPSLQGVRQQAKAVVCGFNIKNLLAGLLNYENENETLPCAFMEKTDEPPGGYPGIAMPPMCDRKGWWWFNLIGESYSKHDTTLSTIIKCPSKRLTTPMLKINILCGNYGVNQFICKSSNAMTNAEEQLECQLTGKPLRSSDISNPFETLLILDSGYSMINWWHACNAPPVTLGNTTNEETAYVPGLWINTDRNLTPGQERDAIKGRHPGKTVNVGFVDGHISREKADDLFVEKIGDEKYKNLSPLWLPKVK